MTDYRTIPDSEVNPDAALKSVTLKTLRDNLIAINEPSLTAYANGVFNNAIWRPYDDGDTAIVWNGDTDSDETSITWSITDPSEGFEIRLNASIFVVAGGGDGVDVDVNDGTGWTEVRTYGSPSSFSVTMVPLGDNNYSFGEDLVSLSGPIEQVRVQTAGAGTIDAESGYFISCLKRGTYLGRL